MDRLSMDSKIELNNGVAMPVLGLGVYQIAPGTDTERAVLWALDLGYRLIDTAKLYGNEESVGAAIRKSGIPREEIFVTTKMWPTDFMHVEDAFRASLKRLGLEYLDLYLIHWPIPIAGNRVWKDFESLYDRQLVRAVGVSNYSVRQLERVMAEARVAPAVNQVKFNPYSYDPELLQYCNSKKITLEAYSPLGRGARLLDPKLSAIADRYQKTPAQVMLRWALQKGTIAIPKSTHRERIEENCRIFDFEIAPVDMGVLDALS